LIRKQER